MQGSVTEDGSVIAPLCPFRLLTMALPLVLEAVEPRSKLTPIWPAIAALETIPSRTS